MNIFFRIFTKNINFIIHKINAPHKLSTVLLIFSLLFFIGVEHASAAVIPGEGVPHIVDTPNGEIETTDNVYNASAGRDSSFNDDTESFSQSEIETSPTTSRPQATKSQDMPEVPNFDASVDSSETVKHQKNSNNTYIIIGLVILLVGLGLVFVAKSRRE
ncbi:LPXTG cell wall anchor domain-containing protein [bacterium]|nr:LPXTG cell wall anchor domain-containing protein [bacterium]